MHCWEQQEDFLIPFLNSTSWLFILAKAFWNNYGVTCSTARRNATAMNEMDGYVTAPSSAKTTHHSSTADWIIKF